MAPPGLLVPLRYDPTQEDWDRWMNDLYNEIQAILQEIDIAGPQVVRLLQQPGALSGLQNFINDAAASAGGVPVGGLYRNGSVLQVRVT